MHVFETVIALLLAGACLAGLARRLGAPYPALVALAGAMAAMLPGIPALQLDPNLALALFVAPVLADAAFDTSARDLRANWSQVASLALGAVTLTVLLVALVAHLLEPGLPWAAAIALGAIVAPPDAAAATTILKELRPPLRILVILEGESLFNDASALIIYRAAVAAVVTGVWSGWSFLPTLVVVCAGSVLLAVVMSRLMLAILRRISDVPTAVVAQFCSTFFVWFLAEWLHLSAIITIVVMAMLASQHAATLMPARIRLPAWAFWDVTVFVLNVLAFILVGFQLRTIGPVPPRNIAITAAVCLTVILARFLWITGAVAVRRWRREPNPVGARSAALVGWCGMRGTVTLASALALPDDFPYRDLMLTTAFGVTLGTLVIQGLTLRPFLKRLGLDHDDTVDREIRTARLAMLEDAVEASSHPVARRRFQLQLARVEAEECCDPEAESVLAALQAQRRKLLELRGQGTIGDAAFHQLEEELDRAELGWAD